MVSTVDLSSMEPLFPEPGPLEEPALAVVREAGALGGQLHPVTRASVADLLRAINTYHSNLIEGHDSRPHDIERAWAGSLSTNPERRALIYTPSLQDAVLPRASAYHRRLRPGVLAAGRL